MANASLRLFHPVLLLPNVDTKFVIYVLHIFRFENQQGEIHLSWFSSLSLCFISTTTGFFPPWLGAIYFVPFKAGCGCKITSLDMMMIPSITSFFLLTRQKEQNFLYAYLVVAVLVIFSPLEKSERVWAVRVLPPFELCG